MVNSMTGYAAHRGDVAGASWSWELRGVNARGLDLRMRLPDWIEGLEPQLRAELSRRVQRGAITLTLRVTREDDGAALRLDEATLQAVLAALRKVEAEAEATGVTLAHSRAADLLALRGVLEPGTSVEADTTALREALLADFPAVIEAFEHMRAEEGAALARVIGAQLDQVATLTEDAASRAGERRDAMATKLSEGLAAIMEGASAADPGRVEQELALLYVKTDVTEEVDRLRAHVDAARALLGGAGPVGRKLDFLMQEFNREANTLCSKAQSEALTRIGLDLKTVIDQMREQVQNVE